MVTTKVTGLGDNFYVGGYDLSGDVSSLDQISMPQGTLEATGMTQKAMARLKGMRDGAMSFTSFMDVNFPAVATPAVPASTVPAFNPNNYTIRVTITGGTLTFVFVNGVQVGTTAGTYVVPANGYISITYSVAPTWNWFSLGTEHDALKTLPSADVICSYFQGVTFAVSSIGQPAASMVSKQTNYDPTRDASGNISFKVTMQANAFGLEWGQQLTSGLRTDNGAVTGPVIDQGNGFVTPSVPASTTPVTNTSPLTATVTITGGTMTAVIVGGIQVGTGAGVYTVLPGQAISMTYTVAPTWAWSLTTAFGCQAYLHLIELVGTNIDVQVQHATTSGGSYTSLIDFGSQTVIGGYRQFVSNTTPVNEFLKVVSSGTFTQAVFGVNFVRNPVAGVVF